MPWEKGCEDILKPDGTFDGWQEEKRESIENHWVLQDSQGWTSLQEVFYLEVLSPTVSAQLF